MPKDRKVKEKEKEKAEKVMEKEGDNGTLKTEILDSLQTLNP